MGDPRRELLKPATPPAAGWAERVEAACAALSAGERVMIVDTRHEPWDADLTMAVEHVGAEAIRSAEGLTYVALPAAQIDRLGLGRMAPHRTSTWKDAFTVSVEARDGVSGGVSAFDRAHTVAVVADPRSGPEDLSSPGHVFPLRADPLGVVGRAGATEGSVDLARIAGLTPAGVLSAVLDPAGATVRGAALLERARQDGLAAITVAEILHHRWSRETLLEAAVEIDLPTVHGVHRTVALAEPGHEVVHLALVKGDPRSAPTVDLIVRHQCLISDVFHVASEAPDVAAALELLAMSEHAVLVYATEPTGAADPSAWAGTATADVLGARRARAATVALQALLALGVQGPVRPLDADVEVVAWLAAAGVALSRDHAMD